MWNSGEFRSHLELECPDGHHLKFDGKMYVAANRALLAAWFKMHEGCRPPRPLEGLLDWRPALESSIKVQA